MRSALGTLLWIIAFSPAAAVAQPTYSPATELVASQEEFGFAARVRVKSARNAWLHSEHGSMPFLEIECELVEAWKPHPEWASGSRRVLQADYGDFIFEAIAPPPVIGREYLLWGEPLPGDLPPDFRLDVEWAASHPGMLLIRRAEDGTEFVHFGERFHSLDSIRALLAAGARPLDEIVNPVARIETARRRLETGTIGDEEAFVRGLSRAVLDPEGESRLAEAPTAVDESVFTRMVRSTMTPYHIRYHAIGLLVRLAEGGKQRDSVLELLRPLAAEGNARSRFVVGLALARLGDAAAIDSLLLGFDADLGDTSMDPDTNFSSGAYHPYEALPPFQGGSAPSAAYALGLLGDARGLASPVPIVRLAAADGLCRSRPATPAVREALAGIAGAEAGENLRTNARKVLARSGDDRALEALVREWSSGELHDFDIAEFTEDRPELLVDPLGFLEVEPARRLERIRGIFSEKEEWESEQLLRLRASLGDVAALAKIRSAAKPADEGGAGAEDIAALLTSDDAEKRIRGISLAAQGRVEEHFDAVLAAARTAPGHEERFTAIRALGEYRKPIAPEILRELIETAPHPGLRLTAFEVATRVTPAIYAEEGVRLAVLAVEQLRNPPPDAPDRFFLEQFATELTRFLSRLPREGIPQPLFAALGNPDPAVRALLVRGLAMSGNPDAIPHLRARLEDEDAKVRETAEWGLRLIGDPR